MWRVAAGCVDVALSHVQRAATPVVISAPRVHWMRDARRWVACDGPDAAGLQCAPVGPADALVGSEMLSVRQDALFGGGHAKCAAPRRASCGSPCLAVTLTLKRTLTLILPLTQTRTLTRTRTLTPPQSEPSATKPPCRAPRAPPPLS
eukprot:6061524-Prymnesium_polylepis.1